MTENRFLFERIGSWKETFFLRELSTSLESGNILFISDEQEFDQEIYLKTLIGRKNAKISLDPSSLSEAKDALILMLESAYCIKYTMLMVIDFEFSFLVHYCKQTENLLGILKIGTRIPKKTQSDIERASNALRDQGITGWWYQNHTRLFRVE